MGIHLKILLFLIISILFIAMSGCSVSKHTDLTYLKGDPKLKTQDLKLDVFSPKSIEGKQDVFIFLHGGGWSKGKKSLYKFLGKRMARKGIIGVVMDYPLSPQANYNDMAIASAKAVKWVKENISVYGGDPERIFISGHSAGGHLAALISTREKYFESIGLKDPIKGIVLIDAAGLDMYKYLTDQEIKGKDRYLDAFTKDHAQWTEASPIYHLHKGVPPMLIFVGGKTYPNIKDSNERFAKKLAENNLVFDYKVVKGKHHVPMIFQLYNANNRMYDQIISFMKAQK
jgi:acetyl esterase/lipase